MGILRKGRGGLCSAPLPLLFAAALVLASVLFLVLPTVPCLVVEAAGRRIAPKLALPVEEGESFGLRFTHSLNLSDVTDEIEVANGALVCRSTLFSTYGAGIPDLSDGIGTRLEQTEAGYLLTGVDKTEREIDVMLQTVPDHRLIYRGREIRLLPRYGSGTIVRLSARRASLAAIWLSR